VVVEANLSVTHPAEDPTEIPAATAYGRLTYVVFAVSAGIVAEVKLMAVAKAACVVVPAGSVTVSPHTSQSPAVNEIEVTLAGIVLDMLTADPPVTVL
jgi:hypothetical protein